MRSQDRLLSAARLHTLQHHHRRPSLLPTTFRIRSRASAVVYVPSASFSADGEGLGKGYTFPSVSDYHAAADDLLEATQSAIEAALEDRLGPDFDTDYSQGVLTVSLGNEGGGGTYVLNKQTPNQQIWWSSPLSGPKRFEFDPEASSYGSWVSTRDASVELIELLGSELKEQFDVDIEVEMEEL